MKARLLIATICLGGLAAGQTEPSVQTRATARTGAGTHTSAKRDLASGAGDIGKGAAKGAGSAAKGPGRTAADLVTLRPVNAGIDLGKGVASTGKNVGSGAVKGTAKMVEGAGKAIKHLL